VKLVVVTSNPHKAAEVAAFFGDEIEIEHRSMEIPEFRDDDVGEIARRKAEQAFAVVNQPLIVDDTAFSIAALHGFPGPYAAYVLSTIGNKGILKLLEDVADRKARFETAIALATAEGVRVFRGRIEGIIVPPRGHHGFGYDPIFEVEGRTLAELSLDEKSRISHRARALADLKEWLLSAGLKDRDQTVKSSDDVL
jgi:XTP/dITP diphosphohydrolase